MAVVGVTRYVCEQTMVNLFSVMVSHVSTRSRGTAVGIRTCSVPVSRYFLSALVEREFLTLVAADQHVRGYYDIHYMCLSITIYTVYLIIVYRYYEQYY